MWAILIPGTDHTIPFMHFFGNLALYTAYVLILLNDF